MVSLIHHKCRLMLSLGSRSSHTSQCMVFLCVFNTRTPRALKVVILLVHKEQLVHYPDVLHASTEKNYINIFEADKTGIKIFFCVFILDRVSSITTTRHIIQP
jgi:hypothetical protein